METVNIRQSFYHGYRKNNPNPNVNVKLYIEIVLGFIKHIMANLFKGSAVRLPGRLGILKILGTKRTGRVEIDENGRTLIKGLRPNWPETKKFWANNPEAKAKKQVVFYFNEHTNGYMYSVHWYKKNMIVKNKFRYEFSFSRANKKELARLINEGAEFATTN